MLVSYSEKLSLCLTDTENASEGVFQLGQKCTSSVWYKILSKIIFEQVKKKHFHNNNIGCRCQRRRI